MSDPATVAAAVIVSAGRVLLVRRRVPEAGLVWQLPAGKVEPGESVTAAAVREAAEETSLAVTPVRALGERVHPATGRRVAYVACAAQGGVAKVRSPREVSEVAWAPRESLPRLVPGGFFGPVQDYLDQQM